MKRIVEINGRRDRLEWTERDGSLQFVLESGEPLEASVEQVEPSLYSVLIGGRSLEARVEHTLEGPIVVIAGNRYAVNVIDPRQFIAGATGRPAQGSQDLRAPMPGKVVRVLVAEGDTVEAGQGVVVVEAMKMQNEMKSPKAGRLTSLAVKPGASVNAGEILATIE
ncbi:MAG: biotin/lipoyl-containing protein [Bryobacteraceae bacterium]